MTFLDVSKGTDMNLDAQRGSDAAHLIWEDKPEAEFIIDPRTPAFAHAMIDASVKELSNSRGLVKRMINRAAAGAEDLAVAQFQGIIEVLQNADDVRANEVRFAIRGGHAQRQLLIVHDGEPVTCHNVLGMALPYLTTKTERTDQRGRFGIGMKTLKRIAHSVTVHSAPYHFSGDQLRFERVGAEPAIPGFYDPDSHTMLVVGLNDDFEEIALAKWFETWSDDSLLFLASVSNFQWCELDGTTRSKRALSYSPWADVGYTLHHPTILNLKSRRVDGPDNHWTVWRATIEVPPHLHPAHKARSEKTHISIALAAEQARASLFIGFRTNVPSSLPFSLDAQFDPSTSREAIIENPWNSWLIERSCEVVANIASGLLSSAPEKAWLLVPLEDEYVGEQGCWLQERFSSAWQIVRDWLAQTAVVALPGVTSALTEVVYEDESLSGLLREADMERIALEHHALHTNVRDELGRWRQVMEVLNIATVLGTYELLEALNDGVFCDRDVEWWVEAGARLIAHHPDEDLFGHSFLLSDRNTLVACMANDDTDKPIVFDAEPSAFAARWNLLERLNPAYGASEFGKEVIAWLTDNAAFTSHLDAAIELAAFAEQFNGKQIEITDEELRDLRASFDQVLEGVAEQLGPRVGSVLLLDGQVFRSGKPVRQKVALSESYLCKTLDGENSSWPEAAGKTPDISWIAAKYESILKTDIGRWAKRKREDGSVSRGARRFLMLLGAETAPRILQTVERVLWGDTTRVTELRQCRAEQVAYDLVSPDLSRVLNDLQRLSKRDAKLRSSALFRTLSRNWERLYFHWTEVPAEHVAIKHTYRRGEVTAAWLNELRNTPWIAVGRGDLVMPRFAVLRTPDTEAIYQSFAWDLVRKDVSDDMATALSLITDVRIGDLLARLEEARDSHEVTDGAQALQIYRTIAKRCPPEVSYNTRIGELTVQELRRRFLDGDGLIYVGKGLWRRPNQVMRGMDIFHGRRLFVPGGVACVNLWVVLDVAEPNIDDCISFCRDLVVEPYGAATEAALMDVYRYMGRSVDMVERKHREKLRNLPLYCNGVWTALRPVFYVEDAELRDQLVVNQPSLQCWRPPCDLRNSHLLARLLAIETLMPDLKVVAEEDEAAERGEQIRLRFGHAVGHLSSELARSEPTMRDRIKVGWDLLKSVPLFIYDDVIPVRATSSDLPTGGTLVSLRALLHESPFKFYFRYEDIGDRDFGGKTVAALFPPEIRRRIDAEWALAWQKSRDTAAEEIRLASDEKRAEAMHDAMTAINASSKGKIAVTPPKSRNPAIRPRTLKDSVGSVVGASIQPGSTQIKPTAKLSGGSGGLRSRPPEPSKPNGAKNPTAPTAYTNADLEQRGWEILAQALDTSPDQRLIDFRNRHGVGADGAFDWERFVEMKATARSPQTQVELSNNEFERARQRGSDFILALVSGLETGYKDEVRLIFDPANCAVVRPTNGVRLVGLLDAPAVIIYFNDADDS